MDKKSFRGSKDSGDTTYGSQTLKEFVDVDPVVAARKLRDLLSSSHRTFSDSTQLIRQDRER